MLLKLILFALFFNFFDVATRKLDITLTAPTPGGRPIPPDGARLRQEGTLPLALLGPHGRFQLVGSGTHIA